MPAILFLMIGSLLPQHGVVSPCAAPDADPWVAELGARVSSFDGLYAFARDAAGEPVTCTGEVRSEFDGARFGVVVFTFADGTMLEVETMPPEASIATLRRAGGFENSSALEEAFRTYVDGVGVEVEWSAPAVATEGGRTSRVYSDPDDGLNAFATLVYESDALVEVRFSLAL